jgi:hypothetical protein
MTMKYTTVKSFLETSTGKFFYNMGIVVVVFISMSLGMTVFADDPSDSRSAQNPITHYLWQLAHYQEIQQLSADIDYAQGRLYMFKRMKGQPSQWSLEERDQYDVMYDQQQEAINHYHELIAKYNGDDKDPEFQPKLYPKDYMPYATR